MRDAKPRTAPMARRRDGDIAPYRNGTAPRCAPRAHEWGARDEARAVRTEVARVGSNGARAAMRSAPKIGIIRTLRYSIVWVDLLSFTICKRQVRQKNCRYGH